MPNALDRVERTQQYRGALAHNQCLCAQNSPLPSTLGVQLPLPGTTHQDRAGRWFQPTGAPEVLSSKMIRNGRVTLV